MLVSEDEFPMTDADALSNAVRALLDARTSSGQWEGELASSALSTATAVFALHLHDPVAHAARVGAGLRWLVENQNADGGWGDTTLSFSNVSTTALCWAALAVADGADAGARGAVERAEGWLTRAAGSLEPAAIARTIAARYGKDRTFSVPILTMCALAGRLGAGGTGSASHGAKPQAAWGLIPQLPFELAALPQSWFRFARLPVVSYALPALISMGLARHRNRPTRNPVARGLRAAATRRVLRVLEAIQPAGGGFLEATPLTSFVAMSLIGAGLGGHAVVARCVEFLEQSARDDGSWPIDTNLATWVTTLSVNALAAAGPDALAGALSADERAAVRGWLLGQQYRERHPYTGAPPGAWAWTDLPGGVPDADDTAGALIAVHNLSGASDAEVVRAAGAGVIWLLDLQNGDGGIPTFCRGWTNLPFDRSGADLTAHALQAWHVWQADVPPDVGRRLPKAVARALAYLRKQQRPDGAWSPLWFGNQSAPDEENLTYGTARVLIALLRLPQAEARELAGRGVGWLLANQNADDGWGGACGTPSSVEETALALSALGLADATEWNRAAIERGRNWLVTATDGGRRFEPSPIGFYFAKLWYFERLYPLIFTLEALGRTSAAGR